MGIFGTKSDKLIFDKPPPEKGSKMGQAASGAQERMQQAAAEAAGRAAVDAAGNELRNRWPQCAYLTLVRTIVGYIAVFGVWSAAIANLSISGIVVGIYLLIIAIPITLLELAFFFNKLTFCANEFGPIGRIRSLLERLDSWKRGVVYGVLVIPCFIPLPFISIWAVLFGLCLMTLSVLYCAKTCQYTQERSADYQEAGAGGADPRVASPGKMDDASYYNNVP